MRDFWIITSLMNSATSTCNYEIFTGVLVKIPTKTPKTAYHRSLIEGALEKRARWERRSRSGRRRRRRRCAPVWTSTAPENGAPFRRTLSSATCSQLAPISISRFISPSILDWRDLMIFSFLSFLSFLFAVFLVVI